MTDDTNNDGLVRCKESGCDEWAEEWYNSQCPKHWDGKYGRADLKQEADPDE